MWGLSVWDIRDKFGDTNLLIVTPEQEKDAAQAIGSGRVVLLRGHGMIGVGRSVMQVVRVAKALLAHAEMYLDALRLGPVRELTPGEIEVRNNTVGTDDESPATFRGWEYEAVMAGCRELLMKRNKLQRTKTQPDRASSEPISIGPLQEICSILSLPARREHVR
jgi:hypothetical protein